MNARELLDRAGTYYRLENKAILRNFTYQRRRIEEHFGDTDMREVGALELDRFKLALAESGLKPSSINVYFCYLGCAYKQAVRYGEMKAIPPLPYYRVGTTNARQDFFELEDVQPLLKELARDPAVQAIVECALFSGMRIGELKKLEWGDVRPDGVYLPASKAKSRKPRKIPMNRRLQAVFQERRRYALASTELVFHRFGGQPIRSIYRAYKGAVRRIGKPHMTIHACRRTFARWLSRNRTPPETILKIMGWGDYAMLLRYSIINDEDLDAASERMDEFSGPRPVLVPRAHPLDVEAI